MGSFDSTLIYTFSKKLYMELMISLMTLSTFLFFKGTLGQPKIWDITNPVSYQHPMAPYDVLVDPHTLPKLPKKSIHEETAPDHADDTDLEYEVGN